MSSRTEPTFILNERFLICTLAGSGAVATPIFSQRQLQEPVNTSSGTGTGMPQITISNTSQSSGVGQQQVTIATAAAQLTSSGQPQLPVGASASTIPIQFQRIQNSSTTGHGSGGQGSVSVFRGDGSVSVQPASVTSQQQPPQAHTNIAMTATPVRSSTQPAPPAHITQTPVTQPAGNIKPEPIGKTCS